MSPERIHLLITNLTLIDVYPTLTIFHLSDSLSSLHLNQPISALRSSTNQYWLVLTSPINNSHIPFFSHPMIAWLLTNARRKLSILNSLFQGYLKKCIPFSKLYWRFDHQKSFQRLFWQILKVQALILKMKLHHSCSYDNQFIKFSTGLTLFQIQNKLICNVLLTWKSEWRNQNMFSKWSKNIHLCCNTLKIR